MSKRIRYFLALVNFNNAETDPAKMSWEPVRQTTDEASHTYYDIFGSDEGVEEHEIVVFGPEIQMPKDFEWGE